MSERYQREIEEILDQADDLPVNRAKPKKRSFLGVLGIGVSRFLGGRGWHLSPGRIMLGSLALLLIALLFKSSMPGLVAPLAWTAVVLFILGYALFFINPRASNEKRWRGRVIETVPSWWDRFLRRVKGR